MNAKLTLVLFAALVAVASAGNLGYGSGQRYGGSHRNFDVGHGSSLGFGRGSQLGGQGFDVHRQRGQQYYQSYRPSYSGNRRHRRSASGGLNYGGYGSSYGNNYRSYGNNFGRGGQGFNSRSQSYYPTNNYGSYGQYYH